jgi:hypothetical protein
LKIADLKIPDKDKVCIDMQHAILRRLKKIKTAKIIANATDYPN